MKKEKIYSMIFTFNGIDSRLSLRNEWQELRRLISSSVEIIADVKSKWRKLRKQRDSWAISSVQYIPGSFYRNGIPIFNLNVMMSVFFIQVVNLLPLFDTSSMSQSHVVADYSIVHYQYVYRTYLLDAIGLDGN